MNKKSNIVKSSNAINKMLCGVIVEDKQSFNSNYYKCGNHAKYKVEYDTSTGRHSEYMCGVHFRAFQKVSEKIKRRFKIDKHVTFVEI